MSDISYISGVVKILEAPKKNFKSKKLRTRFRVQFPQIRSNLIVSLNIWGTLANDVNYYYTTNDYIFIEGYFSTQINNSIVSTIKTFNITVLKIYPVCLN